jgi:hypothetical protein
MLVKVDPPSVDSCTWPKSHGQPAPPFVSDSVSCCCQNDSRTVFDPAGIEIARLVTSVPQLSP